jgi:hypothetical protein
MLAPVFQFGERDAGPREAVDGNSAKDGSASPETKSEPDEKEIAQPPALAADGPENLALPPGKPEPATEPGQATETQEAPELDEAERLYSQKATGDVTATSAMHDLPRDVRAARLCVTELREQLKNSLPPYFPDLLPSYRLAGGTVLDVRKAAFRTNGRWYDLSYRCEVDTDATKVVSFALSVGAPVPPDEWKRRGLPTQ